MSDLTDATIKEVKAACHRMFYTEETRNIPINVMGPPGIGKTDLFEQLAEEWGADYKVFLTATMDPTDIVGVPHEKDGVTHFCPPREWIALTEDCAKVGVNPKKPIVAVLEDLPSCSPQVFNSLLRPMCNGEIASSKIRKNVLLGATGNRVEDKAGAAQITTALSNRFLHFSVRVDMQEWVDWAIQNAINPYIVSYVERSGVSALHNFDPTSGFLAFPTPRSVAMASNMMKAIGNKEEKALRLALSGCCGQGWAGQFMAFFRIQDKVISVEEIFANPKKAKIPKGNEIDLVFSTINNVIFAVLNDFSIEKAKALLIYVNRIDSEEFVIMGLKKFLNGIMNSKNISPEDQGKVTSMEEAWGALEMLKDLAREAQ